MKSAGVALLAMWLIAWSSSVFAQQSIDYASISGRVSDPSGAAVADARVTVRQTATNLTAEGLTDHDGRFRFPYLRVGAYELAVDVPGFDHASQLLTLTAGSAFELPIALTVSGIATSVTVTGAAPVLEAARSQVAATVSQEEVKALPLNGRNFLDLALLVPGVAPANVGATQLFPETSAVPGVGISVGSQRNFSNSFIVDGLSANDDAAGLSGIPYSVDAVDQFQVVTSGGQAELGRALGGYVNVVTRSGTNDARGDVYGYLRDDALNARNALSSGKLPMHQQQFGGSIGGPVVRDRTFYFANVEQRNLDQSGLITIAAGNVAAINDRLAAVGYRGPRLATGEYPSALDTRHVLAKLDHRLSGSDQASVRYSAYGVHATNSRNIGGLNAPSAAAGLDNLDQAVAASNVIALSPRTVNETRAQFADSDLTAPPADPVGPAVSIAGVATFGTSSGNPTGRANRMLQVVDSVSHQAGAHALRGGVDVIYNDDTITFPRSNRGSYVFSSLANFLAGVYNNAGFTQTFGTTVVSQTNPNIGLFAQDEWKAGRRLTVNAGLRYDLQVLETIETDTNNVSPRLGVAWLPLPDRQTVVRLSAGLFYDRVPLRAVANALLSAGNTTDLDRLRQQSVSLSPGQAGAPTFPAMLGAAVPSVTLVNLTTIDRRMQNANSRQASVEIEHQLTDRATMVAGYSYLRGADLIIQVNQNVPSCVAAGTNNGCRPNATFANNNQYSPLAHSTYHGWYVSLVRRPAAWGSYRVSYTYSRSMNNVGENFFSAPIDPLDLSKDWGRSDNDQRHRVVMNGTVTTHGFQLSGMAQYYSAPPFNITSGVTTIQGTAGRPVVDGGFIRRNAGIGSDFLTVNARVSRRIRIASRAQVEGLVEGFNLTNRRNNLARNTNFGAGAYPDHPSPTFGQITAVGDPRTVQVGLRISF